MMRNPSGSKPGLPYLLAEALRSLIYTVEGTLHGRLNSLSLIYSLTKAITDTKHKAGLEGEDKKIFENISTDIEELRNTYEPDIDISENSHTALFKRTAFETTLDLIQTRILYIIQKYEIIDGSMIGEVQATKWRD
jgi:hypothetical protein